MTSGCLHLPASAAPSPPLQEALSDLCASPPTGTPACGLPLLGVPPCLVPAAPRWRWWGRGWGLPGHGGSQGTPPIALGPAAGSMGHPLLLRLQASEGGELGAGKPAGVGVLDPTSQLLLARGGFLLFSPHGLLPSQRRGGSSPHSGSVQAAPPHSPAQSPQAAGKLAPSVETDDSQTRRPSSPLLPWPPPPAVRQGGKAWALPPVCCRAQKLGGP